MSTDNKYANMYKADQIPKKVLNLALAKMLLRPVILQHLLTEWREETRLGQGGMSPPV